MNCPAIISNAQMVHRANKLIATPQGQAIVRHENGDTSDIMASVMNTFKSSPKDVSKFAQGLKGPTVQMSCINVWKFVKNNIKYLLDPLGYQYIPTPAVVWKNRYSDCKGYSIFIKSLLTSLNIPCKFRFVSYSSNSTKTHVYVIVPALPKALILDCCMDAFNTEKQYTFKTDL